MNTIEKLESKNLKDDLPSIAAGDTVKVHVKVQETNLKDDVKGKKAKGKETVRERIQVFEGVVIALKGSGAQASMTVRKVSFGEGVERIFPLHSRTIDRIEVVKHAHVRRAKLYYLRDRRGKAARMKERRARA
jgi:large subunit ribosomal protein L19